MGGGERKEGTTMSIGVLDIFGFECFKRNGFEQLCINYTNERLQKQFNSFVFEEEQRLYAAEGIRWDDVEWRDNSGTLEAIGGREGILRTLDDECRLPKGSDMKFVGRLHKLCEGRDDGVITADKKQRAEGAFVVKHFAGGVEYQGGTGWVEKNKDEVPEGLGEMMEKSSGIMKEVWEAGEVEAAEGGAPDAGPNRGAGRASKRKGTVGSKFKQSLNELMDLITGEKSN
ncbi:hypothetical protein TrRE_jg3701 [Triparma retinervis]|uniref:Myosin motor domain-containing protein n=1 Tax=Triparma retinervis TaxID=2557542 RepID=A0A9W7G419_9STRA|nr:hypothetical protein TrRE_jg3701 [Triparma retinervis]